MSNKILILSQYFPPEIGAPQNRLFGLAKELQKINFKVTVLTALPNYPKMEIQENYKGLKTHFECIDGINTHRTCIYVSHKKGIVTHIKIEYYKKARGKITAICDINSLHDNVINTKMYNEENVLVGEMYCTWDIKNKEV